MRAGPGHLSPVSSDTSTLNLASVHYKTLLLVGSVAHTTSAMQLDDAASTAPPATQTAAWPLIPSTPRRARPTTSILYLAADSELLARQESQSYHVLDNGGTHAAAAAAAGVASLGMAHIMTTPISSVTSPLASVPAAQTQLIHEASLASRPIFSTAVVPSVASSATTSAPTAGGDTATGSLQTLQQAVAYEAAAQVQLALQGSLENSRASRTGLVPPVSIPHTIRHISAEHVGTLGTSLQSLRQASVCAAAAHAVCSDEVSISDMVVICMLHFVSFILWLSMHQRTDHQQSCYDSICELVSAMLVIQTHSFANKFYEHSIAAGETYVLPPSISQPELCSCRLVLTWVLHGTQFCQALL